MSIRCFFKASSHLKTYFVQQVEGIEKKKKIKNKKEEKEEEKVFLLLKGPVDLEFASRVAWSCCLKKKMKDATGGR